MPCQLANSDVEVLNARTVAAHVQRVEVVDVDVLAAVVPLACPELGVRLTCQDVAGLDEGLRQIAERKLIPHEEVKEEFKSWPTGSSGRP